ncbi:CDD1 cytidine deaminase-like protein [Kockiozyma suomiensis]|uniref:CDD1 cytidine deaminase-like protein n=1 Tax=Kockiozyma suomiensis TaxID=1337062 RepID=UPI00334308DF
MAGLSEQEIQDLRQRTLDARSLSYSPYSNFKVGSVLYTSDKQYIAGANIENASYGACICAEQTAIVKAVTTGHKHFTAIGVASSSGQLTPPCGICRQVIREFAPQIQIYMFTEGTEYVVEPLTAMLPRSFGPEDLLDTAPN